jgi:hypothetical protein
VNYSKLPNQPKITELTKTKLKNILKNEKKSFIKQGTEDIYYLPKEIIASKKPYLNLPSIYAIYLFF